VAILFITANRLGDAVLSTGVLSAVIAARPHRAITVACGPLPAPLFTRAPQIAEVIALEKKPRAGHWIELWKRCRAVRWELIVDLRNTLVSRLLRARERRIHATARSARHRVVEYARVLNLDPPPAPQLWLSDDDRARAAALIPDGAPVLALAPAANWRGKTWAADRFAELAQRLIGSFGPLAGGRVAIFAAENERADIQAVIDSLPLHSRIDLVGRTDPLAAAAALERCALFVGNDSGLMHMAAALNVPTLGLFGPSNPALFRPWGPHTAIATTRETWAELVGTAGFDHRTTGSLMTSLTVDAAMDAAVALWNRTGGAP
jgi:lipopolysaccharide export system permease protein